MSSSTERCRGLAVLTALALSLTAGCTGSPDAPPGDAGAADRRVTGTVTIDGSNTLFPVAKAFGAAFEKAHPGVTVVVTSSSTGDGFHKLCTGRVDIAAASRPINAAEIQTCSAHDLEFLELPVAFDSLTVVVSPRNTFAQCLTVAELRKMWQPEAEGGVHRWSDIRPGFPTERLALFGPGNTSGTFDYFTLAIVGAQGRSRGDYTRNDDDSFLANAVASDPNALAYLGYAYYRANQDRLKAVSIDNGRGCVAPSADTAMDGTYQPLTRPIFLYPSRAAIDRPEVLAFTRYATSLERTGDIQTIGYLPLLR